MRFKNQKELMNLPNFIKFGLEIEVQNCDFDVVKELLQSNSQLQDWKVVKDDSLTDNGIEIVSPPLNENKNPDLYEQLELVLDIVKNHPKDKNRKVYVDENCGGHIHFDSEMMKRNPEMINCFLKLWKEAESLIYKMCNAENDLIRESALKITPENGLRRMMLAGISEFIKAYDTSEKEGSSFVKKIPNAVATGTKKFIQGYFIFGESFFKKGFAYPIGKDLDKVSERNKYIQKVFETKRGTKIKFNKKLKGLSSHYSAINLQHLTKEGPLRKVENFMKKRNDIDTYEFRIHNCPPKLDVDTFKENILFDSAFSKVAYEMAYEPKKNNDKLLRFFEKDITEEEKADRFLELLFENKSDREIYKSRWNSVKNNPIYDKIKNTSYISENDLKEVSSNHSKNEVYKYIRKFLEKAKGFIKDENSGITINKDNFVFDYGGRDDE